jgi:hypothetical protein
MGLLQFLYIQRIKGFTVPDSPHFESAETTEWFRNKLGAARGYVEFGSGGSTCLAAKLGKPFASVDSDRFFLEAVKRKVRADGFRDDRLQRFVHADIGLTKMWGKPLMFRPPSARRLEAFARYSDLPAPGGPDGVMPDLILVDGRFRVACALKAAKALTAGQGWTIMVDDYRGRPDYAVLEEFLVLDRHVGRAAVFTGLRPAGLAGIDAAISRYEHDPA